MDRERSWQEIERARLVLADLVDGRTDEELDHPSLCGGWRVRDVAAHVAMAPRPPGARTMLVAAVRARGSFHRLNHDLAVRHADEPGVDLARSLREHASSRRLPPVTNYRNILYDTLVHVQDVAIPLGREVAMPTAAACAAAERVWTMGWPFWARRRLAGFRLYATDVAWAAGAGPREVHGPIEALLLLITGRAAALPRLTGDGVAVLTERQHTDH